MKKNLLIIGAGGYGRVILSQCLREDVRGKDWEVGGFLDDRQDILDGFKLPVGIVGDPMTFVPGPSDVFVCALGEPRMKKKYTDPLVARNALFINLRSSNRKLGTEVSLGDNVRLKKGIIFEPRVLVAPETSIGDFVTIGSTAIIGHDVQIGAYSFINAFAFIGSGARIGEFVTIHPHSTILPGLKIGSGAVIGAGSVAVTNVPENVTVFGNPAKKLQVR